MQNQFSQTLRSAILAGVCIGIAGFGFLALGGLAGAVLFAFGLSAVINYKFKLFTGFIGFIASPKEISDALVVILGNIIGCLIVALIARLSPMPLQETAQKILQARLATGALKCGGLAIGCGFIMTTAVNFGRQGRWLPLIFGVPLFIICGFPHCIADAFYYLAVPAEFLFQNIWDILLLYVCLVIGNSIGCNLYRIIMPELSAK